MRLGGAAALALLLAGCSSGSCGTAVPATGPGPLAQEVAPDFGLFDVNPTSPGFDGIVSPRDLVGRTSAWYFGSAT